MSFAPRHGPSKLHEASQPPKDFASVFGDDLMSGREYSEDTARVIDEEVQRILRSQQDRARQALTEQRDALDRVAAALLDRETMTGAEVAELIPTPIDPPTTGEPVVHTPPS